MANTYTIETKIIPGVHIDVDQAEYVYLTELGLVKTLVSVTADTDLIVVSTSEPASPATGTVWINGTTVV